jgi:hypothetical protein
MTSSSHFQHFLSEHGLDPLGVEGHDLLPHLPSFQRSFDELEWSRNDGSRSRDTEEVV